MHNQTFLALSPFLFSAFASLLGTGSPILDSLVVDCDSIEYKVSQGVGNLSFNTKPAQVNALAWSG